MITNYCHERKHLGTGELTSSNHCTCAFLLLSTKGKLTMIESDDENVENVIPRSKIRDDQNDSDEFDDWHEDDNAVDLTTCLFCPEQFATISVAIEHCYAKHDFNLIKIKEHFDLDFYSYIKMINYIRIHKPDARELCKSEVILWNDEKYLKPLQTESWLMLDVDALDQLNLPKMHCTKFACHETPYEYVNHDSMQKKIDDLLLELKHKEMLLKTAMTDMCRMKEITKRIVENEDKDYQPLNCVSQSPIISDSDYFNSYSHYDIHLEMLSDTVRTEGYRDAILKNMNTFKDAIVLDVGCGTSILSMFAARAGAKKVYGIDQSDIVFKAMDIVRQNNLHETIELLHGRLEDISLPVEKVDIIVSEWMGYFLLFEGMLDTVIYARNHYLKPAGVILPNFCTMKLAAVSDKERYDQLVNYWDDVYGFKMGCMKTDVIKEAVIEVIPAEHIVSESQLLIEIDINTCTIGTPDFSVPFNLLIEQDCAVTALVGFFDVHFKLEVSVEFSTGPRSKKTHWKQTVFYLPEVLEMKAGRMLKGTFMCKRKVGNVRGLSVTIRVGSDDHAYCKYHYNID